MTFPSQGIHKNQILAKLHKWFPSLPYNAILTIFKTWSKRLRLLMRITVLVHIRWLIETKLWLRRELPLKFVAYMFGYRKGNYSRKWRARRLQVSYHKCARTNYNESSSICLGMMSYIRKENIQFIRDDLNKKSLDDILLTLKTHPSEYVQREIS